MSESNDQSADPSGAFVRMWTESCSKIMQAAMTYSPDAVPPEMLRQIRTGLFQTMSKSWDQYMRSPQFLEGMKQMMDNAVAFRKTSTDFLTKAQHEFQGAAHGDLDQLAQKLGQMETRLVNSLEKVTGHMDALNRRLEAIERAGSTSAAAQASRGALPNRLPPNAGADSAPESYAMSVSNTSAHNPWAQWQEAVLHEGLRDFTRWSRLPSLWQKQRAIKKGATPSEVVYAEDGIKLLHYPEIPPRFGTPLLLVFALVNRPYILDLKQGRSVVSHFVEQGFDTYLLDWGTPTLADRHRTLDDYVNGYLLRALDHIRGRTGAPEVSILGYCMGGTMSAMFTALHPDRVRNLLLLAAGIDFATREGLLNLWTDAKYFDVDKFIDAFGNCPAEFLQTSFLLLNPVQNLLEKPINLFEKLDDDRAVDDFLTMETWLNDNIAVPGEVFREFIKYLYQQNLMVQNRLPVGGHIVNLKNITCPVLNIMARADDLVPCGQSLPFNDLVGSADRKAIVHDSGHIGLAVGGKAQREVWPEVCEWLAKRS